MVTCRRSPVGEPSAFYGLSWARRVRYAPLRNRGQQTLTMAERTDAELFQVCVIELAENGEINVIFSECRRVLSEAQAFQPFLNIHG